MPSRQMNTYNALKEKGLSDSEALAQAFGSAAKGTSYIRKVDKEKRKRVPLRRKIKMAVTGKAEKKAHSRAGKAYLKRKKKY